MIARISHRITAAADAADYRAHLETEELPARRTAGGAPGDPAGRPSGGPSTGFGGRHGSALCGAGGPRRESSRRPPPPGRGRAGGR